MLHGRSGPTPPRGDDAGPGEPVNPAARCSHRCVIATESRAALGPAFEPEARGHERVGQSGGDALRLGRDDDTTEERNLPPRAADEQAVQRCGESGARHAAGAAWSMGGGGDPLDRAPGRDPDPLPGDEGDIRPSAPGEALRVGDADRYCLGHTSHILDISISLCHFGSMDQVLAPLRAIAEPTRLRLVALCAAGEWCVTDLVEILGQSQPRLSRHLKLLCDAGVLVRQPEGANVYLRLAAEGPGAALAAAALAALPADDPVRAADRRRAAARAADRAREAIAAFQDNPAAWDEMRALGLPASAIEEALLARLPAGRLGRVLDIGCGTGRMLSLLAPRADSVMGIDLSRRMLALARARIGAEGLGNCTVRQGDMARLPLPDVSFDLVLLCMVLHYADDPAAVLAEAARVTAPGGTVAVIDLAPHERDDLIRRLAHTAPGLSAAAVAAPLADAGLVVAPPVTIGGSLPVLIHLAAAPADAPRPSAVPASFVL